MRTVFKYFTRSDLFAPGIFFVGWFYNISDAIIFISVPKIKKKMTRLKWISCVLTEASSVKLKTEFPIKEWGRKLLH